MIVSLPTGGLPSEEIAIMRDRQQTLGIWIAIGAGVLIALFAVAYSLRHPF